MGHSVDFSEQWIHTGIIRQHYVFLLESLDAKYSRLLDHLHQAEVLSPLEVEVSL